MSVVPNGYTTVAPWIATTDTRALLDFVARVFDGTNATLVPLEDGSIGHAEVRVGDTVVLNSRGSVTGALWAIGSHRVCC